jgi:hypothetical protein
MADLAEIAALRWRATAPQGSSGWAARGDLPVAARIAEPTTPPQSTQSKPHRPRNLPEASDAVTRLYLPPVQMGGQEIRLPGITKSRMEGCAAYRH